MADTICVLRGPGGKLGRPDEKNTGPWAGEKTGYRGMIWDGTDKADERYHHVRPAADQDMLVHVQNGSSCGWDATSHSPRLDQQGYYKPDGDLSHGWGETWQFYNGNKNGAIMAVVEYGPGFGSEDGTCFGFALAVEVI